jgi:hypothetical protein
MRMNGRCHFTHDLSVDEVERMVLIKLKDDWRQVFTYLMMTLMKLQLLAIGACANLLQD